jgi:uncharacterized pyridoxamine 5'-phosphate oxidase family protein
MAIHAENGKDRQKHIKFLFNFIKEHKLGVISTVTGDALPESAVVGISVSENLEIIFSSFSTSRKYHNLLKNPRVSFVIGWEKGQTVQYEGEAKELTQEEAEEELETSLEKIPSIAKFVQREYEVVYKVAPKWLRFTNLSADPWDRFELKF